MVTKIMVVDDEPQIERLILQRFRRKIKEREYEFSFALDGVDALEKLKHDCNVDVILCDINMPRMDGLTLISKLNELESLFKTVMVSAYGDLKNIRTAMNLGAYDFVTKPIDFEDLEITIQKTIREIENLKLAALAQEELNSLHRELDAAYDIQQSILTKNFSIFNKESNFEIYAEMIPAKEIGGDFYDFFMIDDTHLGLVIGDVSGKGMPAALFMAISRTLLKAIALKSLSTDECLNQVNYLLSQDNPKNMFVTLFYGVLNISTGKLEYSNGGHNAPCLLSADGELEYLDENRTSALGVIENLKYKSSTTHIGPGRSLILYTDGITEAVDKNFNEFSSDRMQQYLGNITNLSSKEIIKGMIKEVNEFAAGAPQSDDITMMVIIHNL
jgi:sigma-B regulation protein RsbU (phosphoserine phosphatase)